MMRIRKVSAIIISLLIICGAEAFGAKKKNILVLPIKSNLPGKVHLVNQQGITESIMSHLIFEDMSVASYRNAYKIGRYIEKRQIPYSQIGKLKMLRGLDYMVVGDLHRYSVGYAEEANDIYVLTVQLVDARTGKIVLEEQNDVIVPKRAAEGLFFVRNGKRLLPKLNNPQVFDLTNPLGDKIISRIRGVSSLTNGSGSEVMEIMFVVDSTRSMKDEILGLKNNLRSIIAQIRSRRESIKIRVSVTDYKNVTDKYRARTLPFTTDISKVENYLATLLSSERDHAINDMLYGLNYGIHKANWSVYENHPRVIFLLTDQPVNKDIDLEREGNSLVMPVQNLGYKEYQDDTKSALPTQIHQALVAKLKLISSDSIINNKAQTYLHDSSLKPGGLVDFVSRVKKKYKVRYFIESNVKQEEGQVILSVRIRDTRINKIVFMAEEQVLATDSVTSLVNPLGKEMLSFFTLMDKDKKIVQKGDQPDINEVIRSARSKSIHVYTIGCSGVDEKSQILLQRMSQLMGGDYHSLRYNFSATLTQNRRVNFIYENHELYESVEREDEESTSGKSLSLKNISLGQKIRSVEKTKQFLLAEGYPILYKKGFQESRISNNLADKVLEISRAYFSPIVKYDNITIRSGQYEFVVKIKSMEQKEYNKLKRWFQQGKVVVICGSILSSTAYESKYYENNRPVRKILRFIFHPGQVRVYHPNELHMLPGFLIKNVTEINQNPYFYQSQGITSRHFWCLKGKVVALNRTRLTSGK